MTKATILSVEQTEKAGLFTLIFEGEDHADNPTSPHPQRLCYQSAKT